MKITNNTTNLTKDDINTIVTSEVSKSQKMKALFEAGLEVKDIANLLGVRYNFVYNVVSNHCIVKGITPEKTERSGRREDIVALLKTGMTLVDVARKTKLQYNYIWKIAKEEGLTKKEQAKSTEQVKPVAIVQEPGDIKVKVTSGKSKK